MRLTAGLFTKACEMRKHSGGVLAAALVVLVSPIIASAQSANKCEAKPTRRVKGHALSSASLPNIRIKFDKALKYIGAQRFVLYNRSQVEQYLFLEADNQRRIKRRYMTQFEGYLPNIRATYNYPPTKTINLGGQTYIVNAEGIPNVPVALKQNPQSDVARAASFLESKGYRISESIIFQR